MSARRTARPCANPLCGMPIEPGQAYALEVEQMQPDGYRRRWYFGDLACMRQWLALVDVQHRARAERSRPGAESEVEP